MDNSIVVVEERESHGRSSLVASKSKLGSLVQIDSIAIDLSSSMEETEPQVHEHFTMRGFVAGMRKMDQKKCLPFASEGYNVDALGNLPPMLVPRFRWWQCSNCIPDIETKRITNEMVVATRSDAGNELQLRENAVAENKDQRAIKKSNICSTERHETSTYICTSNKGKIDVRDKEAGSQCDVHEVNPLQIIERLNSTADASDMVCVAEHPSFDETDNVSSGNDKTFSAFPLKRKPKLRSLADILVKERNPTIDHPKRRSTEIEAVLGPQPGVDIVVDVAKADAGPERKRKIDHGKDGGPLAKRFKDTMLDGGKNCRRMEVSDPESERDASMRMVLGLFARNHRIKPKKTKALDIIKRTRQIRIEEESLQMRKIPQINSSISANSAKHNVSRMGETGQGSWNFQSGKQMEKVSCHSNSNTGEVGVGHDRLMPHRKSNLGDCNIRGKIALDLSLNSFIDAERISYNQGHHRGIPDLNEESPENTAIAHGQHLTALSEKLPPHKTFDVSASCSKQTSRESKRKLGFPDPKNRESKKDLVASDDIPMEIVELLAQNQRERALENSRTHIRGINNTPREYSEHPCMIDFPLNRRNSLTVENGNIGVRQNIPLMNMEESQFRLFSLSAPNQQRKTQFAASSTGPEFLWSSRKGNAPCHLSYPSKNSVKPSGTRVYSSSNQCQKRKTTCDMKDGKEGRVVHSAAMIKERRMGPISTSIESLDPYSNDTIPAMQLLSLMDQRVVSGSSFEVGTKSSLDKSFSRCDHHPLLHGKENQKFLSGSFFTPNRHSEELSGPQYGVYCSGESSKKASSNIKAQKSHEFAKSKAMLLERSSKHMVRNDSALGVCTLNRNPADFSIPNSSNEFTLSSKDFKFRKRIASKENPRMDKVDGRRRQGMRKEDASGKLFYKK